MDRERLPEQAEALDEIVRICEKEQVSLVLVAGDVFDTFLPSAEAEETFYRAVKKLAGTSRAVVIVSGNHDDGVRLSAASSLAEEQGIYIFGNKPRVFRTGGDRPVCAVEAGENSLVIRDAAGEKVYLNALPYPSEARLREEKTEESFPQRMERWIARGEAGYRGDMPHIFLIPAVLLAICFFKTESRRDEMGFPFAIFTLSPMFRFLDGSEAPVLFDHSISGVHYCVWPRLRVSFGSLFC